MVYFYDDAFKKEFQAKAGGAKAEFESMIRLMKQIFKHKSLQVKIQLDTMAIENAQGQNWVGDDANPYK